MEGTWRETRTTGQHVGLAQSRLGKGQGRGVVRYNARFSRGHNGAADAACSSAVAAELGRIGVCRRARRHGVCRRWDEDWDVALVGTVGQLQNMYNTNKDH